MSNNNFFNHFFKKDKLWSEIQSNPIAHQYNWSDQYVSAIHYHPTNRDKQLARPGRRINTRLRRSQVPHIANANDRPRLRMPANRMNWNTNINDKSVAPTYQSAMYYLTTTNIQPDPNPGNADAGYRNPVDAATRLENIRGFKKYGLVLPYDYDIEIDDDYWFPNWEGSYAQMHEKSKAKMPYPREIKTFHPPKMNSKQTEAFFWLNGGNYMNHIDR